MIEIKELDMHLEDMHLEDTTLVHNTKGHEKREGHRWKGKSAAYVEELLEYVWKVADYFMPAHVEPWEENLMDVDNSYVIAYFFYISVLVTHNQTIRNSLVLLPFGGDG